MPVSVTAAPSAAPLAALREIERATIGTGSAARVLAVAARADGSLHLAREVERDRTAPDPADPSKRVKLLAADGSPERERVLKVTGNLADFADALAAGLIEV